MGQISFASQWFTFIGYVTNCLQRQWTHLTVKIKLLVATEQWLNHGAHMRRGGLVLVRGHPPGFWDAVAEQTVWLSWLFGKRWRRDAAHGSGCGGAPSVTVISSWSILRNPLYGYFTVNGAWSTKWTSLYNEYDLKPKILCSLRQ